MSRFLILVLVCLPLSVLAQVNEVEPNNAVGDPGIQTIIDDIAVGFLTASDNDIWYLPPGTAGMLTVNYLIAPIPGNVASLWSNPVAYGKGTVVGTVQFGGVAEISVGVSADQFYLLDPSTGTATGIYEISLSLTPLPVELVSFEAFVKGEDVSLLWETASETDNTGFEVERAAGTDVFRKIAFVDGHGTTLEPQEYRYTVTDLSPGRHLFRLKQIDFDGAFEYSEAVEATVTMPDQYALEAAYPNPFNPSTTIRFAVAVDQPVTLTLFDTDGRAVRTLYSGIGTANEMHSVRINGEGLASGVYMVRLLGEGFTATERVILAK